MAIELEVIGFSATDINDDPKSWKPKNRADVFFPLFIEVGEVGKRGGNFFQIVIATPEGIRRVGEKYGEIPDRNIFVCLDYNWTEIEARISRILVTCSKNSWEESIGCLQRYFQWEYEQ